MSGEKSENRDSKSEGFDAGKPGEHFPEDKGAPQQPHPDSHRDSNFKPQTKEMEVHHHGHVHHQRKWKEYLFQFLMLFLAVFCGFLAEYQLEHVIESKREKQFANSLLNDLRLDTAWLATVIKSAKLRIQNIDSAMVVLALSESSEIPISVYQQLRNTTVQIVFIPNNGTIVQLKNSGGMRLLKKRNVVDSIEKYDRQITRLEIRRDIAMEIIMDFIAMMNKSFSSKDLLKFHYDSVSNEKSNLPVKSVRLNNEYANELTNKVISMRLRIVSDIDAYDFAMYTATNLIGYLKKEYHLE